jgi:hypothetical protein
LIKVHFYAKIKQDHQTERELIRDFGSERGYLFLCIKVLMGSARICTGSFHVFLFPSLTFFRILSWYSQGLSGFPGGTAETCKWAGREKYSRER